MPITLFRARRARQTLSLSDVSKIPNRPLQTQPLRSRKQRSRWSEGRGPRGMRTSKARTGRRPGKRVTGAGTHRASSKGRTKERFTALLNHINTELLEEAFFELAQNATKVTRAEPPPSAEDEGAPG